MKKKLLILSTFLSMTMVFLTSCKVNWFDKQYDAPWWAIAIPVIIFSVIVLIATGIYLASKEYICPQCNQKFRPKWWRAMLSIHVGSDRLFKCPHCGKRGFCHVAKKERKE